MIRKRLCAGFAAVLLSAAIAATPAIADDYPSKPIKFIVPTAPAGVGDQLVRLFQQKLGESGSTATIVVENRAGAAGVIGTDAVAKAAPTATRSWSAIMRCWRCCRTCRRCPTSR